MKLHLDFETRSEVDLTLVGAWAYALHPSTEILCMTFGSSPDRLTTIGGFGNDWRAGWEESLSCRDFDPQAVIVSHNVAFEYAIYNLVLHRRYGWPERWDPKLWDCTMARALMCGLPADLDRLSRVLEFKTPKDLGGRRVMHQLCKPIAPGPVYDEDPAKMERLKAYNRTDVLAEIEADAFLPELPPHERPVFEMDLEMNRRGMAIDVELARGAAAMAESVVGDLNDKLWDLTGGRVSRHTQRAALMQYLRENGVEIPTYHDGGEEKETMDRVARIEMLARPGLSPKMREVINIRHEASKASSVAKYAQALRMVCPDGRVRGNFQYSGAHTMRWAGRLLQPQNFPKGFTGADAEARQAEVVRLIKAGDVAAFVARFGTKAMGALSDTLRGLIVAGPGKVIVCEDFNAVEARVLFWLAGARAALAAYARGESPYVEMANLIYRRTDISKKKDPQEYDIGKRTVLGCGFGLGWRTFKANVYEETAKQTGVPVLLSDEIAERAVTGYRELYPDVVRMWREVEAAAIAAVKTPGTVYQSCGGRVLWSMTRCRRFLAAKLPSSRYLWYFKPEVKMVKTPWGQDKEAMVFWGVNSDTNQWEQLKTYGGLLTENVVQAVARDLLVNGMLNARAAGFPPILTVHDECGAEVDAPPTPGGKAELLMKFAAAMTKLPNWAEGCPVAVEGWVGGRYRK